MSQDPNESRGGGSSKAFNLTIPRRSLPPQQQGQGASRHVGRKMTLPTRGHQSGSIPRKSAPADSVRLGSRDLSTAVFLVSEDPFLLRIRTRGVPLDRGGIPRTRTSGRAPKRKRPLYQELQDTDSEDFLMDSDEEVETKRGGRLQKASSSQKASVESTQSLPLSSSTIKQVFQADAGIGSDSVEAPPPGVLSNLWYSRENVLHVFVVEKIIAWKSRPVVKLDWKDQNELKVLDRTLAASISAKALAKEKLFRDPSKRTEVSRINPSNCPVVLHLAANKEKAAAGASGRDVQYTIGNVDAAEQEEVLLVKWRGRSYLHCSWERKKDLEKFDVSNNTARNKIRRFFQSQEVAYGKSWRAVLNAQHAGSSDPAKIAPGGLDEEVFPPQYTEVERLLACDESEMKMEVFAKQRGLNIRDEQELVRKRERADSAGNLGQGSLPSIFRDLPVVSDDDEPWDPEDYVRYVVKWKGLQYSEMTWEYWKDIKRDAVDQAEDFWERQKPPEADHLKRIMQRSHPHIRDFRKLTKSPEFAISQRVRQIANLDGSAVASMEAVEEDKETRQGFRLRNYQLEGVNWLLFNWFNKRASILADEMGLGKTIQSVCFLHQLNELRSTQVRGPFLVVAPLSLIGQWQSESQTWAPDMNVVLYHGSADARDFLVQQEFFYTDQFVSKQTATKLKKQHVTKFHILITTYEVVLKDINVLSKIRWQVLVVDEAHRLKNPKSRLFEELASVPRDFCLLLTGTPLQNSTEELFSLLHFAAPATFSSRDAFVDKFGQLTDAKQVSDLHALLKPYLLRRVKEDVEKSLPPKEETILEVTLTPIQKTYYKAIYERNTGFLFKGAKPSNAPSLMNIMMELRKCCNHPFLVRGAEERILSEAANAVKEENKEGGDVVIDYVGLFGEKLIKSSGKMVLLDKLLPKLFSGGHKVLIFSQMVRVLDLLEELLKLKRYRYERLDGSTSASSRASAVDRFNRKSCQRFVMLLSTRAGGLGLNLTAADSVIIFDSDWNPQNDLQAMARAHRIGQTRAVRVYRLLTAKTYEMHMFHSASMKLGLDRAVLAHQRQQGADEGDTGKTKAKSEKEMQAKEIDELLKKGAYDVFRDDDDDKEAQKFMETDIDQLLEQSAKKVTYSNTSSSISSGLGSFSKASFVADTGDGGKDVDLDDPDFWAKAVGLDAPVETPEELAHMIDDGVKRNRKQVQVYDPYAAFAEAEQKKKDKVALKAKEEKEERQRLRKEKKQKKLEEKERKKRAREETKGGQGGTDGVDDLGKSKDSKSKKAKKSERSKALKRAEFEDPVLERLKQAWEAPQRNRATAAVLRFGFGRFCKVRNDCNLTSLPAQDMEAFTRSYVFQLSLQCCLGILGFLKKKLENESDCERKIRPWIEKLFVVGCRNEVDWICNAIVDTLPMAFSVITLRRSLRLPSILNEAEYLEHLRRGHAFRALRRLGVLSRLNCIVEDSLDSVLSCLGHEELGKRGCPKKDMTSLDSDLKARHVTNEELSLSLGLVVNHLQDGGQKPAVWWDRSCDISLIIGSFVHGLGNYEAMRGDNELKFGKCIRTHADEDVGTALAFSCFIAAAAAARRVFDEALESSKAKEQLKAHAAVAAALSATKKAETEGQSEAALKDATAAVPEAVNSLDTESDDFHLVTLPRLAKSVNSAFRKHAESLRTHYATNGEESPDQTSGNRSQDRLPMPDARVLDVRLLKLVGSIEDSTESCEASPLNRDTQLVTEQKDVVSSMSRLYPKQVGANDADSIGIGLSGNQCGASHRSLDDGSNYAFGAATAALTTVAQGNDAPRYLRALGIPINVTRFAVGAVVYADQETVENMLSMEKRRNFGKTEPGASQDPPQTDQPNNKATLAANEEIPLSIKNDGKLRATICAVAVEFGCPGDAQKDGSVDQEIWNSLQDAMGTDSPPDKLFAFDDFAANVRDVCGQGVGDVNAAQKYVFEVLLPHCLRVSIYGNGPTTRTTRVSKGKFETAFGVSHFPDPFAAPAIALPDPMCGVREHSLEAVLLSFALLRRARLLRAAQFAVSGAVSHEKLLQVLDSPILRQSMAGLPLWWHPHIHDVGLLVKVATHGLAGASQNLRGTVFDPDSCVVKERMDAIKESMGLIPDSMGNLDEDVEAWLHAKSLEFPTQRALERRIGLVCSEVTAHVESETVYYHFPMFDHGGWPRD